MTLAVLLCWQGVPISMAIHRIHQTFARHHRALAKRESSCMQIYMCCHCASQSPPANSLTCAVPQVEREITYFHRTVLHSPADHRVPFHVSSLALLCFCRVLIIHTELQHQQWTSAIKENEGITSGAENGDLERSSIKPTSCHPLALLTLLTKKLGGLAQKIRISGQPNLPHVRMFQSSAGFVQV